VDYTKILTLGTTIFGLKMMMKSGLDPSEISANLLGQFSLSRQIFLALDCSRSEGARSISKKKKTLDHFSPYFLSQKCFFQDLRF
jgi:hypothetical protein